jgi:hypothetical protein
LARQVAARVAERELGWKAGAVASRPLLAEGLVAMMQGVGPVPALQLQTAAAGLDQLRALSAREPWVVLEPGETVPPALLAVQVPKGTPGPPWPPDRRAAGLPGRILGQMLALRIVSRARRPRSSWARDCLASGPWICLP